MPELIEAGYVYIAKPPLYKLRNGKEELYIEKEGQLEELLLDDKLEQFEIADSKGKRSKLSKRRWQQFNRLFKEYEGWSGSLRGGVRPRSARLPRRVAAARRRRGDPRGAQADRGRGPAGGAVETELKATKAELVVKAVHRRSGLARTHTLPAELFQSNDYRKLVEVHGLLLKHVGRLPFEVALESRRQEAISFGDLRRAILELARTASRSSASRASAR